MLKGGPPTMPQIMNNHEVWHGKGRPSHHATLHVAMTIYKAGAGGLVARSWTCDHLGHGFESHRGHLRNNLGQVVYTYVPRSPSSITWYWSKDSDALRLGR